MSELDNLRPEVRSALGAIVRADVCRDPVPTDAFDTIRAELLRLADECAMIPRAQLLANLAAANERAEKAEAELATAQNTINAQQGTMGALKRKLALAEAELTALKARIRGACLVPLTAVMLRDGYSLTVSGPMSVNDVDELAGKCVRLVVEE